MSEVTKEIPTMENDEGVNLESTLHQLLTDSNDLFADAATDAFDKNITNGSDVENAIESAINSMNTSDLVNTDLLNDKQLSLETLLGENSNPELMFDMEDTNDILNVPKHFIEETSENSTQLYKKARLMKENFKIEEPFLSPASLSPSSSLSPDNNETQIKLETIPLTHYDKRKVTPSKNTITATSTKSQIPSPAKYTNEFTMMQVTDVKKRIINTHKLMLNFNFLKDGYARTCVQLKKTMNCLKDSEVHRAHLLAENEQLKQKLAALTNFSGEYKNNNTC